MRLVDVSVTYRPAKEVEVQALCGLDLNLAVGATALMGPSGSGKSTLLNVIAGTVPFSGEVRVHDRKITMEEVRLCRQDSRVVTFLSCKENIQLSVTTAGLSPMPEVVADHLASVGLADLADRMPPTLSGGQVQRLALAKAIAASPTVLLADEPTASLDSKNSLAIADLIRQLAHDRHIVALVATHDEEVARRMDRTVRLHDGSLAS